MGQALQWNPEKEEFSGANAKEANQWLAREMRKPVSLRDARNRWTSASPAGATVANGLHGSSEPPFVVMSKSTTDKEI